MGPGITATHRSGFRSARFAVSSAGPFGQVMNDLHPPGAPSGRLSTSDCVVDPAQAAASMPGAAMLWRFRLIAGGRFDDPVASVPRPSRVVQ